MYTTTLLLKTDKPRRDGPHLAFKQARGYLLRQHVRAAHSCHIALLQLRRCCLCQLVQARDQPLLYHLLQHS